MKKIIAKKTIDRYSVKGDLIIFDGGEKYLILKAKDDVFWICYFKINSIFFTKYFNMYKLTCHKNEVIFSHE